MNENVFFCSVSDSLMANVPDTENSESNLASEEDDEVDPRVQVSFASIFFEMF